MLTLVTGATGLVGNNVVRLLLERGERRENIRALVRAEISARPLVGLDVEVFLGDVCDEASVQRAIVGVNQVVHAAAVVQIGWHGMQRAQQVNVEGTRHVAAAARSVGARMVHVSSCDTCGFGTASRPADEDTPVVDGVLTPYVVTKRAAEKVVQEEVGRGLWATIVNPGFMLGPWDWRPSSGQMLVEIARGRGFLAPRGTFSLCDVRDVAAGILAALERGQCGRKYILAGHTLTYLEAWRMFAEAAGARRPLGTVRPVIGWLAGRGGDLWGRITGHEPNVNSAAIAMALLRKDYSCARAESELGYHMRPVGETIADALAWFREHGYLK
ncbi:MAG: NAD-dependent epimerase/dehydratase family protein [Planctomycetia bacterium]|nr:NAD-dependent epimerase/dehydratase family protein [Planctomycetia bacterium]